MRTRSNLLPTLLPGLLGLLLSACAGFGVRDDSVRVTVSDIRIVEATLLEQVYQVTLRVQNRTAEPLDLRGGSFDLELDGRDFGSGVTDQPLTVPAYSDARLEVRMISTVFGVLRLVRGLQQRGGEPLDYAISGRFSVAGGFGSVGFHEAGELTLPGGDRATSGADLGT